MTANNPTRPFPDKLLIRRVANGWIIQPGLVGTSDEFAHIAVTPKDLAKHVQAWAEAQET